MKTFMFHYVKPFSNYYHFDLDLFEKTIKDLSSKYHIISLSDYNDMINNGEDVTEDYIMLTFDDGTIDHYKYVYPILKKYNCSGLFFISSCIKNNKVLDIQLIHKLIDLYSIEDLFKDLSNYLIDNGIEIEIPELDNRDKTISVFKSLLQYKLVDSIREKALYYLVDKYNIDTNVFSYYMSIEEMIEMKNNNMFFGLHTKTHPRLGHIKKNQQFYEIKDSLDFLLDNNLLSKDYISMAFPYGSYNEETLEVLDELSIKYGFKVDTSDLKEYKSVFLIDRLDCNILKEK